MKWLICLLLTFSITAQSAVRCENIFSSTRDNFNYLIIDKKPIALEEALPLIQNQNQLKKIIYQTVQNNLKSTRWPQKILKPVQYRLALNSQKIFIESLIYNQRPDLVSLNRKKYFWQFLRLDKIDQELLNDLQSNDYETFYLKYQTKMKSKAFANTVLSISSKLSTTVFALSLATALLWYWQADQYMQQQLEFDISLSDQDLAIFNKIIDQ
ncbi:MAG: hypothetical protein ACOYOK_15410, partial [Pseudobdellovibrionaceae bacterium]